MEPLPDDAPAWARALHHEFGLSFREQSRRLDEIKTLAETTNGRVDELELDKARREGAKDQASQASYGRTSRAAITVAVLGAFAAWAAAIVAFSQGSL